LPLYFLTGRNHHDPLIQPAVLVETPGSQNQSLKVGLSPGQLAPNFEVSTPDVTRVRLSDLRGRPVLINFWARWCTSCLSEMPNIKAVQQDIGTDRLAVVAINAGETRA